MSLSEKQEFIFNPSSIAANTGPGLLLRARVQCGTSTKEHTAFLQNETVSLIACHRPEA